MKLVVLGATGGTGLEVVRQALAARPFGYGAGPFAGSTEAVWRSDHSEAGRSVEQC